MALCTLSMPPRSSARGTKYQTWFQYRLMMALNTLRVSDFGRFRATASTGSPFGSAEHTAFLDGDPRSVVDALGLPRSVVGDDEQLVTVGYSPDRGRLGLAVLGEGGQQQVLLAVNVLEGRCHATQFTGLIRSETLFCIPPRSLENTLNVLPSRP